MALVKPSVCLFIILAVPGKPNAPDIPNSTETSATLKWHPPESDGGSPITSYVIEYRVENGLKWVRGNPDAVTDTTFTIKGLSKGTTYEFRVAAENIAGTGPASEPSKPTKAELKLGNTFKY